MVARTAYWSHRPYWDGSLDGPRLVVFLLLLLPLLAWAVGLIGPALQELLPLAPAVTHPQAGSVLATTQTIRLEGSAAPHARLQVYDNNVLLGEVQSNVAGRWRLTREGFWAAGQHEITVVQIDREGREITRSSPVVFFVQPVSPAPLGLLRPPPGEIDYAPVELAGVGEPNARVRVFAGKTFLGVAQVNPDGEWRLLLPAPLGAGTHQIWLEEVDSNNVVIKQSEVQVVRVLPDAIIEVPVPGPIAIRPTITVPEDGRLPADDTFLLRGTAPARSSLRIYANETLIAETTADENGQWVATTGGLSPGEHVLRVEIQGPGGEILTSSGPVAVEVFGTPLVVEPPQLDLPPEPRAPLPAGTTTLTGEAIPGSRVQVFDNGELLGEVIADARGRWILMLAEPLAPGDHTLRIVLVDADDMVIVESPPTRVTVAEQLAPVVRQPHPGQLLSDSTPPVLGRALPNQIVQLYADGQVIGESRADGDGMFRIVPIAPLRAGEHELRVIALDEFFQPVAASEPIRIQIAQDATPSVVTPPEILPITGGDEPER